MYLMNEREEIYKKRGGYFEIGGWILVIFDIVLKYNQRISIYFFYIYIFFFVVVVVNKINNNY